MTGCEALNFKPSFSFQPRPSAASEAEAEAKEAQGPTESTPPDTPSGYTFQLHLQQHETPAELASPQLRDTTVTLPEGVTLSPSSANGLVACTAEEIGLELDGPGRLPAGLPGRQGHDRLAAARQSRSKGACTWASRRAPPATEPRSKHGELVKLYIEVEGAGVRVKLPGSASVNQSTGQLTTTFLNNPQLPFEKLTLKLKIGPRAPLESAQVCTTGLLASRHADAVERRRHHARRGSGRWDARRRQPFTAEGPFGISPCPPSLPFAPGFSAGSESSSAGQFTNFDVTISRQDGEQSLSGITVHTPPGLLGKIAGIPRCEGSAAESATEPCPAGSQIGTATSAVGPGSEPYVDSEGKVYLTGPYGEGPFGLKVEVPAKAGPFNLGTVVVRSAITIDKRTRRDHGHERPAAAEHRRHPPAPESGEGGHQPSRIHVQPHQLRNAVGLRRSLRRAGQPR